MTPTEEQEAVRAAARSNAGSLMISAYAGCAKTTTLELASKEIKVPALALAFNTSIKNELAQRFGPNFKVMTMNGLGFGAMTRAMRGVNFAPPDGRKMGKLVSSVAKAQRIELLEEGWTTARDLAQRAMNSGLVPGDQGRPLVPDNEDSWTRMCEGMGILSEDQGMFVGIARQVLARGIELTRQGNISFDDQVYYSVCLEGSFPQYPVMMIDEAQDLSPLNHAMLTLARRSDGRIIACGDPKQAIYAFRGADSESMLRLRHLRPEGEWKDFPLTLTFRCPKIVVQRQLHHAPGFRVAEGNKTGAYVRVGEENPLTFEREWTWGDVMTTVGTSRSLAVLCRNNSPLISLAFKLLRKRVSVKVLGRDIGTGLKALSRKLFADDATSRDSMLGALADWEESEVSGAMVMDKPEAADVARDRAESLRSVISFGEVTDAGQLRQAIDLLFSRTEGQVTLSTIHKSKGLEWDAVLHLDPWRVPSKWAKEADRAGDPVQLQQEMNLKYVCETRTRDLLLEASIEEMI